MKLHQQLILFGSIIFLSSCGSKKSDPQSPIVGKWNLQQQHAIMYEDNVKVVDTVYNAAEKTTAYTEFKADNTFVSSSNYISASNSVNTVATAQNTTGTYTYSTNTFTIKPGIAGWFVYAIGSSTSPSSTSQTVQVTAINTNSLTIHATLTFTITNSSGEHTFNQALDYYFTK